MTVQGIIVSIGELQVISDKFAKRQLLITRPEEKFNPELAIDFINKASDSLDTLVEGQEVTIELNLSSREGKDGRWWSSISGWKVELVASKDKKDDLGSQVAERMPWE